MNENIVSDRSLGNCDRPDCHDFPQTYSTQLPINRGLTDAHRKDLEGSGLNQDQIKKTGHFSADQITARELVGTSQSGLIFPYYDPFGQPYCKKNGQPFYRIKPNWGDLKTEDSPKYLSPKGEGCRPYFSRLCPNWNKVLQSTKIDLWETEGEKKGDCGCAHGLAVIAFAGVDAWLDRCDRKTGQELLTSRTLPELAAITWKNRRVNQCFDSDIIDKHAVQTALAKRAMTLLKAGAIPYLVLLPNEVDGSKNGIDDFIVRHGVEALKTLAGHTGQPTPVKTRQIEEEGEDGQKTTKILYYLDLKEPDSHQKALMAWSVLKESWAFRVGIGWYEWQQTHWKLRTSEEFEGELTRFMDAQQWKNRSSSLITSIVRELKSRLLVRDEYWNPAGKLVFKNGTLDVLSGKFTAGHDPYDRITRLRPYAFEPTASCPTWLKFIYEAMDEDEERVGLIRALFRHVILPRVRDCKAEIEKSFDFFGQKGTGKGTTLDVLSNLVGSENIGSASADTFKTAIGLGQLLDKDLAVDHDASGFLGNVGNYNKVVSNEPVEVKKLYQDIYSVRLGVVVVRAYNAFISVPDGSEGLDRRLTVIPFRHQPRTIDIELSQKLRKELPGIFAWCYSMAYEEMKRRILSAGSIRAVAEMSIERFEANNPEFRFLAEAFPDGRESVKAGDLYGSYKEWCQKNQHQPKSNVKFAAVIQALRCRRSTSKISGCYYYSVPRMSDFDVTAHLGIVQRQLEDSDRDSSNPYPEGNGDSCRQFDEQNLQNFEPSEVEVLGEVDKRNTPQQSPIIPKSFPEQVSTILKVPPMVSTVPVVYSSPQDNYQIPPSNETIPNYSNDHCPNNLNNWQPKVGDRVLALVQDNWRPATLIHLPQRDPDPKKSTSFWQVRLDDGVEPYIWNLNDLQPQEFT